MVIASGVVPYNGVAGCIAGLADLLPSALELNSRSVAGIVRAANYLSTLEEEQHPADQNREMERACTGGGAGRLQARSSGSRYRAQGSWLVSSAPSSARGRCAVRLALSNMSPFRRERSKVNLCGERNERTAEGTFGDPRPEPEAVVVGDLRWGIAGLVDHWLHPLCLAQQPGWSCASSWRRPCLWTFVGTRGAAAGATRSCAWQSA